MISGFKGGRKKTYKQSKKDNYPTPEWCVHSIVPILELRSTEAIDDPCCGAGAICNVLVRYFLGLVTGSDIRTDGIWPAGAAGVDYLTDNTLRDNVLTNPPYHLAKQFVEHSFDVVAGVHAYLLPLGWLASTGRCELFKARPPRTVAIHSRRPQMFEEGCIPDVAPGGGSIDYCWVVWDNKFQVSITETVWIGEEWYMGHHRPCI